MQKRIKRSANISKLGDVYTDISKIEFSDDDSFKTMMGKFYKVMTKHGICQGIDSENDRTISNPEWVICYHAFKERISFKLSFMSIVYKVPEHLQSYKS